ncbi:Uma2 family endonuclease [Streptomyces sp. NA04227]|uniref:Uma2 family endonuclease n=1 Tax=Streptomyces sp. NA04227 TaxID=2742136 RepID=UPI001591111F|nr:Uma2 family endonuclease [Streptomyces sp. NA04227]QKW07057.1 Uma2 family endonuclease [Streptomyces sp. NA04227]
MTAEPKPIAAGGSRWPVPPQDGYTVDDLFTLPDLPPHTELIDGSLVFVSPQRDFHSTLIDLLIMGLRRSATPSFKVRREMSVELDRRNVPEPDVCVLHAKAVKSPDQTRYMASDVVLAVEVISPDSEARDRTTKPQKYAAAGIPNFWLVDRAGSDGHPVVYVYELDAVTKCYTPTGIHHGELKTGVPYDIVLDITMDALDEL